MGPLLHADALDDLTWILHSKTQTKELKGINLEDGNQICMKLFVDDMDVLFANKDQVSTQEQPKWLIIGRCKPIQEGNIFTWSKIPMGLKVSPNKN